MLWSKSHLFHAALKVIPPVSSNAPGYEPFEQLVPFFDCHSTENSEEPNNTIRYTSATSVTRLIISNLAVPPN
jgi:hypothetical protein